MKATLTPLRSLLKTARLHPYDSGQLIFQPGDLATETLILTTGIIKVYSIDAKGQEKVLQIIKAPAILPLDCLLAAPRPVAWHYAALTDCETATFSPDEFHDHVTKNHDLSIYIINWLATQSHELLVRIDGMSKSEAKDKIIAVLKFFSVYYSKPARRGWKQIEFPITHQLLADIAGLTRESVSIQIGNLQKEKVVRARRPYLEVHEEHLLRDTI